MEKAEVNKIIIELKNKQISADKAIVLSNMGKEKSGFHTFPIMYNKTLPIKLPFCQFSIDR